MNYEVQLALLKSNPIMALKFWLFGDPPKPVTIDETDPRWIPRVEGSSQQPIKPGDVGQFDGIDWHKIEYPAK
jgi:hypothetical protein